MSSNRTDWTPEVLDVANVLLSRTKDSVGNELGTFTDLTRPTAEQVEELIPSALQQIALRIGDDVSDELLDLAKRAVAMQTALAIEINYYPDQVGQNRSAYQQIKEALYGTRANTGLLYDLTIGINDANQDGEIDADGLLPLYDGFPVDGGGMVGWNTPW